MRVFDLARNGSPAKLTGNALACVLASAFAAGLFVQFTAPLRPAAAAGAEVMAMLRDEHALVSGYVSDAVQAQRDANLAAEQDVARMKVAAARPVSATEQLTSLETPPQAEVKLRAVAANRLRKAAPHESEPVQLPLQLAAMMEPVAPPSPVRPAGNAVTSKVRAVVAVVERVPTWVREAANWVVELPAQTLPRWPDRRFQHISS
jgi:hypothetical protein